MPLTKSQLYLHEEVLLLALRDEEGTTATGAWYQQAIAGAIVAELLLAKRISIEEGKKKFVTVDDDTPMGEAVIDEALKKIATAKRRATAATWVQRLSGLKRLKHRVALELCDRGILRADEGTVLLIFRRKVYPEINPAPERKLIERLRKAIFSDGREIDPRTIILLSLAKSANLLKIPFDKKELKRRKERIEKVINGEATGRATKEAIEAAQAAAMVACIMPAMMAPVMAN